MRILGIDPGVWEFAWAIYDSERNEVIRWGYDECIDRSEALGQAHDKDMQVVIEDIVSMWQRGKTVAETLKTIGWLQAKIPHAVRISRQTVKSVLTRSVRANDAAVNLALGRLVPNMKGKRPGLTGHHRAAAAVAYVGVGWLQKQKIEDRFLENTSCTERENLR